MNESFIECNQLRFAFLNIQCLKSKRLDKLVTSELKLIFKNNDVICLTENWGSNEIDFSVEGFVHYELNRTEMTKSTIRKSRGVIIYVREKFTNDDTFVLKYNDTHIWDIYLILIMIYTFAYVILCLKTLAEIHL